MLAFLRDVEGGGKKWNIDRRTLLRVLVLIRFAPKMARFGEHAVWFEFTSDRFDHSSDPPPEANAGNQFYGRDVASFIAAGLTERGLNASFFDKDWGWQAHGKPC